MRGCNKWSYAPYKPFLTEIGDIYICRIVLYRDKVHFEWLDISAEKYTVYFKKRVEEQFIFAGNTSKCEFTIENLNENEDYEFFVESGEKRSRIRIVRCGEPIGAVVNYLHPDGDAYSFSGKTAWIYEAY